uniref:Centrosomal protein kizuna n=1 Tax=Scophthalmus maximus TaxID=52904 RepID=A0A8D3A7Y4_SCOMX
MRQREKRRLELERELFTYSRSDTRILQIKCSKLRSYLKEISNREARAKMRNLELQRDVECIEISMKEYGPDHGLLRQQKIKAVQIKHRDSSLFQPAKTFTQSPTVIFMDHQTSRTSDAEAGTTSVLSHQALHRSPNHGVHSLEHLPSGRLKEFRVGREDATRNRANLSDDISGSNDSPDACNFTDKHERMMAVLPSVCAFTGASGSVPFRSDDEQELSPLVTSTGPEENPPPSGRGPTRAKDSPAERTDSQEMDLGACGALVLHELRRLSWSTAKGCLLPQDLVRSHQSNPDPEGISASLPPDAARLWDRWFKHALLLKECRVLNTERLVQLFTPLLLECHASYSHQAKVLLRTLLSRSSEECPSAEDESDLSSSRDSPPLPADSDVKPARPVQQRQIQELQSAEEDSQDESPVESVPIRETKAYQLLKQSAMQQRLQSSEEEEEEERGGGGGCKVFHCILLFSFRFPFCVGIWGESDDSNSEIEAALRPQPFNTNNGDIDDFYD